MLFLKSINNRKNQKGSFSFYKKHTNVLTNLSYSKIRLVSLQSFTITVKQLNSCKLFLEKKLKKKGKLKMLLFAGLVKTKKPLEIRMGKGKGNFYSSICKITNSSIVFEVSGGLKKTVLRFLLVASYKLPFKSKLFFSA